MEEKIIILTTDDKYLTLLEWQSKYGLSSGSTEIGRHFSYMEPRFQADLKAFGKLVVCAPLMRVLDRYRELIKEPVTINSFNRTEAYQTELSEKGFRTATTSPHVQKMAADVDTFDVADTELKVPMMRKAAMEVAIPVRIGWKQYSANKQSFIHVDVCPLYYAPEKPRHNEPHPIVWEKEIEW